MKHSTQHLAEKIRRYGAVGNSPAMGHSIAEKEENVSDSCKVCGQTPCNCTHITKDDPVRSLKTNINKLLGVK